MGQHHGLLNYKAASGVPLGMALCRAWVQHNAGVTGRSMWIIKRHLGPPAQDPAGELQVAGNLDPNMPQGSFVLPTLLPTPTPHPAAAFICE